MQLTFQIQGISYSADVSRPMDISIPLIFNGPQPNTYNVPKASAKAYEDGEFKGDTRRGGSCNFETYQLTPHCNGTHTECVGHIADERISIHKTLKDVWIPSSLITVEPVLFDKSSDTYPVTAGSDLVITAKELKKKIGGSSNGFLQGLIIRTLPNDSSKQSRNYEQTSHAYVTNDAMEFIVEMGVTHLLVDLPSVDRSRDQGKLAAHHIFWNVSQGSHQVDPCEHSMRTITEMIYIPDDIADGQYLLNLQIATFVSDAAPSRPLLFKLNSL